MRRKSRRDFLICLFLVPLSLTLFPQVGRGEGEGIIPLRVVLHVHSNVSGEEPSLGEIAALAQRKRLDAVILTDYFEQKVSWGIFPLHRILKISKELPSMKRFGVERYYQISENFRSSSIQFLPGAEVTPFYWWSGSLGKGDWTVHDLQKNILVFGLSPEAMKKLPTIENGSGLDAYHGPKEEAYQKLIDDVKKGGGISVWSTPDESFGNEAQHGPVHLSTLSYSKSLVRTRGYTGIGIYPEGQTKTGVPGGIWDRLLDAYCRGKRKEPVWAFAESVAHARNIRSQLGRWDQMVLSNSKSRSDLLQAVKAGHFYIRELQQGEIFLDEFLIADEGNPNVKAVMGETTEVEGRPALHVRARLSDPSKIVVLHVIRNGELVQTEFSGPVGILILDWVDPKPLEMGQKNYYRLMGTTDPTGIANFLSNPIFVVRKQE